MRERSMPVWCHLVAVLILAGCDGPDETMAPPPAVDVPDRVEVAIFDGSTVGNPYFHWMGTLAGERVGVATATGAARGKGDDAPPLDLSLLPEMSLLVTGWSGTHCTPEIATFDSGGRGLDGITVRKDQGGYFQVKLQTHRLGMEPDRMYCVRVLVADTEVGRADVWVVEKKQDLGGVDPEVAVGVTEGMVFADFRVEEGAVYVVGAEGRTFTTVDAGLTVDIPPGALDGRRGITAYPTSRNPPDPHLVPGSAYQLAPGTQPFASPLRLTFHYLPADVHFPEEELLVHRMVNNRWVEVDPQADGSNVDPGVRTVTGRIPDFGISAYAPWGERLGIYGILRQRRVAALEVFPEALLLEPGNVRAVSASLEDANGNELQPRVGRMVAWASDHPTVATSVATGPASTDVEAVDHGSAVVYPTVHDQGATVEVSVPAPVAAPRWDEDFSTYPTSEAWRALRAPVYRNAPIHPENQFIDPTTGHGGSSQSLRFDFVPRTAATGCGDYPITRMVWLPSQLQEVWMETWVKFSENFTTVAPASWSCGSAPDLKLLFGLVSPDGAGRFEVKVGTGGNQWTTGAPSNQELRTGVASDPYMDGEWHQIRAHWKLGNGDGVLELWVDGDRLLRRADLDTGGTTDIFGLFLGSTLNQGPAEPMSYWWGRVKAFDVDPGW